MKEFNLEQAKAGKHVCTRDGKPARIVCWDRKVKECPIVVLVNVDGEEVVLSFSEKGRVGPFEESPYDLMMASEKKEGWINLYKRNNEVYPSITLFATKDEAYTIGRVCQNYLTTIKIEWEE